MNKIIIAVLSFFGLSAIIIGICTWTYWNTIIGLMFLTFAYVIHKYD